MNLFKDITTFNMLDPAKLGGLSNVNFWAYKNVFTLEAWLVHIFTAFVVAVVYMLIRVNLNSKREEGFSKCYLDS